MTCDQCPKRESCEVLCQEMEEELSGLIDKGPQLFLVGGGPRDSQANQDWQNETVYKTKFVEEQKALRVTLEPLLDMDQREALVQFGAYYLDMSISELCNVFKLKRTRVYELLRNSSKNEVESVSDGQAVCQSGRDSGKG